MKDISIIIPYYKKKQFILRALKSIFRQTLKNYEVLIIYDDQDLSDFSFIKKIIKNKKNFFIYKNKKNLGAGLSRNFGISKSRGKFIAFLDADDCWDKSKLRIQFDYMKKNKCLISHTDYLICSNNNKSLRKSKIIDYKKLLRSCDIGLSTVMIKKSAAIKIKFPQIKTKEDYVYWLKFLKKFQCKIYSINLPLTKWYYVENSLSNNFFQKIRDAFVVYKKYCNFSYLKSFLFTFILSLNALIKKIND